ncbi:LysR family transcriptional regulator ArgP [Rheinheimera sp. 1928-s]|uniref:LysR family transcriptional regulator ArgP n=1 Tax=Rheinheimera sp. 1928-s TaxID=3033803 RepID=UPI00261A04CC|nr:LysR family transcriptional regulator ArgP [Rheinheimera sp. 1928-s]MDF3126410.1 LysR family transcriptional regulator ArgP [Rheinheimera sp. 1928-s]
MIDYRLLQALSAVVEQGGFERAALVLHLTQSAISRRIKQLESVLGQPVLLRSNPPVPTAAGQRLLNHLQQVRQMETALGLIDDPQDLVVRLATNADSLATWLPEALVLPEQQAVRFDLVVEDQSVGLKRMKQGDVMACICASPQPVNGGAVMALGALRYRAVASPAFIQRYQLTPNLAAQLSLSPCLVFNQDDQLQHQYLQHVAQAVPQRFHLCPSSEGFLKATLAGLGFGLLPELQMQSQLDSGELVDLTPGYYLDTELYWHYWQSESPLMYQLRQNVLQVAKRFLYQVVGK